MSVTLKLDGLAELKQALRELHPRFHAEGFSYVRIATDGAASDLRAEYSQHEVTGKLARSVKVEYPSTTVAVGRVVVKARHSHLYEFGTEVRKTARGFGRGQVDPATARGRTSAVTIFRRRRDTLQAQLIAMVERAGLKVSDGG